MKHCHAFLVGAAFVAVVSGLPATGIATDHFVDIQGITFIPPTMTVKVGDKVTWTNNSGLLHTVTSGVACVSDGLYDSPLLNPGESFSYTFGTVGTVPYFCVPHCLIGMTGSITVDETVATENATWGAIKKLYEIEGSQ